jgi:hypothetical protein
MTTEWTLRRMEIVIGTLTNMVKQFTKYGKTTEKLISTLTDI